MKAWKRIEPTTVTKVGHRTIVSKTFASGDNTYTFDVLWPDGQQSVGVIAVTEDNKIVIARQFRPGPEMVVDELPGGAVDVGEDVLEAAKRELLEETGYAPANCRIIGTYHKDAYMNGLWHVVLATGCIKVSGQNLEHGEEVEVDLITIGQLIENARNDRMTEPLHVFYALKELQKLQVGP